MNRMMMKLLVGACICAAGCGDGTMPEGRTQPVDASQGGGDGAGGSGGNKTKTCTVTLNAAASVTANVQ